MEDVDREKCGGILFEFQDIGSIPRHWLIFSSFSLATTPNMSNFLLKTEIKCLLIALRQTSHIGQRNGVKLENIKNQVCGSDNVSKQ